MFQPTQLAASEPRTPLLSVGLVPAPHPPTKPSSCWLWAGLPLTQQWPILQGDPVSLQPQNSEHCCQTAQEGDLTSVSGFPWSTQLPVCHLLVTKGSQKPTLQARTVLCSLPTPAHLRASQLPTGMSVYESGKSDY